MQFCLYQESRRGSRRTNQDRIAHCQSRDALLMLVADGMGGHVHGELAAQIAVEHVAAAFRREATPRLSDPHEFLRQAIAGAHYAIIENAWRRGLPEAPRTTCVACVIQNGTACWVHAGDSRLYFLREGAVLAQTKDHTVLQRLIDRGRISRADELGERPERNQIYSCLGSERPPQVELSRAMPLHDGDSLIMCSDGLWAPLSAKLIGTTVMKMGILKAVPALLDEAERRAGRECDNLSVVAVTWGSPRRAQGHWTSAESQQRDSFDDAFQPITFERTNS